MLLLLFCVHDTAISSATTFSKIFADIVVVVVVVVVVICT